MARTRGVNPIWWIPDLVGNPMDDSYYLFTLSNTIPYIPIVVTHDAAGSVPWSDPIEMLANGTVPIDVYWDEDTVYRLEWRAGPTQDDELVYLVENYSPGEGGGSGPVTNSANNTTNQITNPQFSKVNFTGSYTSTAGTLTDIAPGWNIITSGVGPGSITVTQLEVDGDSGDTTNPSYALQIQSTGWDTVGIQQVFEQNGALWSSGQNESDISGVALEISAYKSAGTAPPLNGIITYTGSSTVDTTIFTTAQISGAPNSYGGASALPTSTNTNDPDSAATAVSFNWTSNNTVVVTSVQLIGQQGEDIAEVAYQQESLERQVDHTFHYYADSLIMQPKPSILAGWKFPLNPWQYANTTTTNVAVNQYTADQTIVVQQNYVAAASGNNVSVGQAAAANNYGLQVTAVTATNQFALVQYIDAATIRGYWGYTMSALLRLKYQNNHASTGITVKMRLIYNSSVPSTTSQTYPIATWTALGEPVFAAGFTAIVPHNDPAYDISTLSTMTELPFEGMTLPANGSATQTLAIVIYTTKSISSTSVADYIVFDDCSLVANDFAIASQILTADQVLSQCEYYYEKSFPPGTGPGTGTAGASAGALITQLNGQMYYSVFQPSGTHNFQYTALQNSNFTIRFRNKKRTTTAAVLLYNYGGTVNNVGVLGYENGTIVLNTNLASSTWTLSDLGDKAVSYLVASPGTALYTRNQDQTAPNLILQSLLNGYLYYQYTADARIGV